MSVRKRLGSWMVLSIVLLSGLAIACTSEPTATSAPPAATSAPAQAAASDTPIPPAATVAPPAPPAPPAPTTAPTTAPPSAPTTAPTKAPEPTAMPETMMPEVPAEAMAIFGTAPADLLTVVLNEDNGSGQTGWATLTAKGAQTEVILLLPPGALETESTHIHSGQCGTDTLGGVVHPLTSFINGAGFSVTTLEVKMASLLNGDLAINTHKKGEGSVYTSCGNIPTKTESVTIALDALNDSGQSGLATLTARGTTTEVAAFLSPGTLETELAHIHSGQCGADTLGGVVHPLTSFVGGFGPSMSSVDATLNSVRTGDFAINSHKKGEPAVYTACGNIPSLAESLTIALNEQNDSGQSGWATLTARGDQTEVVLNISSGNLETELAHIHSGQCGADTLGGVVHPLTSFVGGFGPSVTLVDAPLSSVQTGDFAINLHQKGNASVYTTCGNIPSPAESLTIALNEQNDSGQSGWATLTARGDQTEVVLTISSGNLETELVHIHTGQCGDALGGVAHPLTSFADGSGASITTVDASLSSVRTGDFAINSHKKGEPGVYTTCGNISAREPVAMIPETGMAVVMLSNFQIAPAVLEVQAGEKARFSVSSEGAGHTFTIPTMGVDVMLPAGTNRTVEFDVPEGTTGKLQVLCRFHSSGDTGMVGQLSIKGTSMSY